MRNLLIVVVVVAAIAWALGGRKSDALLLAEARQTIAAECRATTAALAKDLTQNQVGRFCSCSTEKILVLLGPEGIRSLRSSSNGLTESEQQKTQQAAAECIGSVGTP